MAHLRLRKKSLENDPQVFDKQLKKSLEEWSKDGVRGVWLKLSASQSHLIGIAVQEHGFQFHHAKQAQITDSQKKKAADPSSQGYVMVTKWLPDTPNKMPGFASHYVGVGGLVFSKDCKKILAIQETKPLTPGVWKLPGGLVDPGESVQDAAIREVWEETGVKTEFKSVVGFRELKVWKFGQPDHYVVCQLVPTDESIEIQMKSEVAQAVWVPIEELSDLKFTPTASKVVELVVKKKGLLDDITLTPIEYELSGQTNTFYSNRNVFD